MELIKLGGSVLTNKSASGTPRFRAATARRLAREITASLRSGDLALVHGGGSFGHPLALRHGIGRRRVPRADVPRVYGAIHGAMEELGDRLGAALAAEELPGVTVPASTFAGRESPPPGVALVRGLAAQGLVPTAGGDVVADGRLGLRILSGDEIMVTVARALRPGRAVFVTDVDGVRDGAEWRPRLARDGLRSLLRRMPVGTDATGGMRGKLMAAQGILEAGVVVDLVNGDRAGNLRAALRGRPFRGTRLTPR